MTTWLQRAWNIQPWNVAADLERMYDALFADAPINAQTSGSAWRGSRPRSADGGG
jgi:hypothetical protein